MLCDKADNLELTGKHVRIKVLASKLFLERGRLLRIDSLLNGFSKELQVLSIASRDAPKFFAFLACETQRSNGMSGFESQIT